MADIAVFADVTLAKQWTDRLEKKIKTVGDGGKQYAGLLSALVFQDITDHFKDEEGSGGPWESWSDVYEKHMEQIGRGNNNLLQFTGKLRQAFVPTNYRTVPEGILWFNPARTAKGFPYAYAHNEGGPKLPKRDFMWLSGNAMDKIGEITLAYILDDK